MIDSHRWRGKYGWAKTESGCPTNKSEIHSKSTTHETVSPDTVATNSAKSFTCWLITILQTVHHARDTSVFFPASPNARGTLNHPLANAKHTTVVSRKTAGNTPRFTCEHAYSIHQIILSNVFILPLHTHKNTRYPSSPFFPSDRWATFTEVKHHSCYDACHMLWLMCWARSRCTASTTNTDNLTFKTVVLPRMQSTLATASEHRIPY